MEEYLGLFDNYGVTWVVLVILLLGGAWLIKWVLTDYKERLNSLKSEQQTEREKFYKALDDNTKVITDSMELLSELKSIKEEVHTMHEDVKDIKSAIDNK